VDFGDGNPLPQAASPGQAIQAMLVHNVNDRLMLGFSTELYEGFLWNFEDNEFVVVDGEGFRNWFLVRSRLSDNLLLRFKLTSDHARSRNNLETRLFNNEITDSLQLTKGSDVRRQQTSFRLQLDYNF
jgi:hypothetical protein